MSFITEATASPEAAVTSDSHLGDPEEGNPFVPMSPNAVRAVVGFGALYTVVVCAMALVHAAEGGISMVMVALSSAWLIFWTFFPFIFYKPSYGWCHPLILVALLKIINMVPRSTALFMNGLPEHLMLPDWSASELNWLYAYGNVVNSVALMALYAGFAFGPRLPVPSLRAPTFPPQRLYLVLLMSLAVSLGAFWLYLKVSGGLANHIKSLAYGMAQKIDMAGDLEGIGQYTTVMSMATIGAVIWVCAQPGAFRNPAFWFFATCALVLAYMSEGKRLHMIYPAILMMLCWMLRHRKVPYFRLMIVGTTAFFLIGLLGLFRSSNWADVNTLDLSAFHEASISDVGTGSLEELTRRSGYESAYYAVLAKVPREEGLLYGKSYLEWGLRFIPREWWPDKPRGVDVQVNQTFYGASWGLPASAVGEAYWNLHVPGVVLVFFLLGVFKKWFGNMLIEHPEAPGVMVLYMISMFYFDASQNGFRIWVYGIVPALILLRLGGLLGGRRPRARLAAAEPEADYHAA